MSGGIGIGCSPSWAHAGTIRSRLTCRCDEGSATLVDYANTVVEAVGDRTSLIVIGHSCDAFTAPLVADRLRAEALVLLAGMIPAPGAASADWWGNTGSAQAVREQAALDGGKTGNPDPMVCYYHDVPRRRR
jgi:hypothetical protein